MRPLISEAYRALPNDYRDDFLQMLRKKFHRRAPLGESPWPIVKEFNFTMATLLIAWCRVCTVIIHIFFLSRGSVCGLAVIGLNSGSSSE